MNEADHLRNYYAHFASAPYLAKVKWDGNGVRVQWLLDSFYFNMFKAAPVLLEASRFACLNDKVFVVSAHADRIPVLDACTCQALDTLDVRLEDTPACIQPGELGAVLSDGQGWTTERFATEGYVTGVFHDRAHRRYVVIVVHAVERDADVRGDDRMHTLIFFDESFHRLGTVDMDGARHVLFKPLELSTGLYFLRTENKRQKMDGIHVFDSYDFHVVR